jgi:hypothetical protein
MPLPVWSLLHLLLLLLEWLLTVLGVGRRTGRCQLLVLLMYVSDGSIGMNAGAAAAVVVCCAAGWQQGSGPHCMCCCMLCLRLTLVVLGVE